MNNLTLFQYMSLNEWNYETVLIKNSIWRENDRMEMILVTIN